MKKPESPRRMRRRQRLEALLAEVGSAAQVERDTGTRTSYLSALLNASRGLGDELAAKLESRYAKPSGWFDLPLDSPAGSVPAASCAGASNPAEKDDRPQETRLGEASSALPPVEQDLRHMLWVLAGQLAALPEAQRKSVLYFIQEIGKAPTRPHDWIEQAAAVLRTVNPSS